MSRTGKRPIPVPKDVKVDLKDDLITVKGPKGELRRNIHPKIKMSMEDDHILLSR